MPLPMPLARAPIPGGRLVSSVIPSRYQRMTNGALPQFCTLTSTGGDIAPCIPLPAASSPHSIIGQLYPATLLARLVTLELEARRR
jgi:hypothetical protein